MQKQTHWHTPIIPTLLEEEARESGVQGQPPQLHGTIMQIAFTSWTLWMFIWSDSWRMATITKSSSTSRWQICICTYMFIAEIGIHNMHGLFLYCLKSLMKTHKVYVGIQALCWLLSPGWMKPGSTLASPGCYDCYLCLGAEGPLKR